MPALARPDRRCAARCCVSSWKHGSRSSRPRPRCSSRRGRPMAVAAAAAVGSVTALAGQSETRRPRAGTARSRTAAPCRPPPTGGRPQIASRYPSPRCHPTSTARRLVRPRARGHDRDATPPRGDGPPDRDRGLVARRPVGRGRRRDRAVPERGPGGRTAARSSARPAWAHSISGGLSGFVLEDAGRQQLRLRLPVPPADEGHPWSAPLVVQLAVRWEPARAAALTPSKLADVALAAFRRAVEAVHRP